MPYYADRVKETTSVSGTANIVPSGAVSGFRSFATAFPLSGSDTAIVSYCVDNGAEWEVGMGTLSSGGFLITRDKILASSNAGAIVTFTAGTKTVFLTTVAKKVDNTSGGQIMSFGRCMGMR